MTALYLLPPELPLNSSIEKTVGRDVVSVGGDGERPAQAGGGEAGLGQGSRPAFKKNDGG